jgi:hypothetical protein
MSKALQSHLSNALERAWRGGWMERPSLDPDRIVTIASLKAGDRPAEGEWRSRLDLLCRSLRTEARLNPIGRTAAHVQLVKLVAARIRAERWWREHPEIGERRVGRPLIIVGQMRSGTTRIHRLLACDRGFAVNRLFEQLDPAPHYRLIDPRPVEAAIAGALFRLLNPTLTAIHPTAPFAAEEDFGLHAFSIWGSLFEGQWSVPTFAAHVEQADPTEVYAEFERQLQLAAWHRGNEPARPWLLKAPQFAQELDALLARFPDARLVVLRRPNEELVASGASLVWNHRKVQSDHVTRERVGQEWLRKTSLRAERMEQSLARHPNVPKVELDYADVGRDWRSAAAKVYTMLDRPLDRSTDLRMARFIARSTAHQHHHYALEDFGLDRSAVTATFA